MDADAGCRGGPSLSVLAGNHFPYNLAKLQVWRTSKSPGIVQNLKYQFRHFKFSVPNFQAKLPIFALEKNTKHFGGLCATNYEDT